MLAELKVKLRPKFNDQHLFSDGFSLLLYGSLSAVSICTNLLRHSNAPLCESPHHHDWSMVLCWHCLRQLVVALSAEVFKDAHSWYNHRSAINLSTCGMYLKTHQPLQHFSEHILRLAGIHFLNIFPKCYVIGNCVFWTVVLFFYFFFLSISLFFSEMSSFLKCCCFLLNVFDPKSCRSMMRWPAIGQTAPQLFGIGDVYLT